MNKAALLIAILICSWTGTKALATETDDTKCQHQSQSEPKLDLNMVIEVVRHGERASKKIFKDLTVGDNFEVRSKELTRTGAESHHAIGQALRFQFAKEGLTTADTP